MSAKSPLKVVLCWHMHQPEYRDAFTGQYQLPWTYLHAIKDYVDMAGILEGNPDARVVVNFVPILLEQIEDYAQQLAAYLNHGHKIKDPLLAALADPYDEAISGDAREQLVQACMRANGKRLVDRYPPYRHLADLVAVHTRSGEGVHYFNKEFLSDILVWYHLAWLGETVRRGDTGIQAMIDKGRLFDEQDRRYLLNLIGELLAAIVPRYKALAERRQIELSMTPYAHPMIPLLIDFKSAREAMPDVDLPKSPAYPGGEERSRWHIDYGIETFERFFGFRPRGCWPAEGGVSNAGVRLLGEYGFDWVATGETVLRNSLTRCQVHQHGPIEEKLHRAYRVNGKGPACFFRDDGLSDLIGFTYSDWHGDDAVSNFIHHLETIAEECEQDRDRIVAVILDGENAWEAYPENGYHFLTALYRRLADHPALELTTFSGFLDSGAQAGNLTSGLVAGSWVYGTFSTWIGDPDKNQGWDLLCAVKHCFDQAVSQGRLTGEQQTLAVQQLAVCEGSDWFWWFGDYNPAETVSDFERLYRRHLACLYRLLEATVPDILQQVISHGGGAPAQGGVMRHGKAEGH